MSSGDAHLYGIPRPKKKAKEISSSTSLAFSSQLSSLISASSASTGERNRASQKSNTYGSKGDIFTSHNKGALKRALKDLEDDDSHSATQRHKQSRDLGDDGGLDDNARHRARRKMEEKARLYAAMKRGDYVPGHSGGSSEYTEAHGPLIDFDRKWAEREAQKNGTGDDDHNTSSDDGFSSGNDDDADKANEQVTYEDEYGRTRTGTRRDAERMERKKLNLLRGQEELDRMSARPKAPAQIIQGDTIQYASFNPDEPIAARMAELAAKRDRTPTPPPPTHYDANWEIRTKGVGFYQFSQDEKTRESEMGELARMRAETEKRRQEREEAKAKRKNELEKRKKLVAEKRAKKQADDFLENLGKGLED